MQVTPQEFPVVSQLINDLCGVVIDGGKAYLIESRLSRVAEDAGCESFYDLCRQARSSKNVALRQAIVDAITTQETLFFRDQSPFEALQYRVLPELIDKQARSARSRRLRFWSAACSTGQEVYSLAITLAETIPSLAAWDVNILGTDISNAAIEQASRGSYSSHEIARGMHPKLLSRYFREEKNQWRIADPIRGLVTFARRNLLEPFADLGPFDVIFCRNVAIYFDPPDRCNLFLRLADRLQPGGYLFAGSAECLSDLGNQFTPHYHCRATYYQPSPAKNGSQPGSTQAAPRLDTQLSAASGLLWPQPGTPR